MNLLPGVFRTTTSAKIGTGLRPIRIYNINFVSGSTASTATLKVNGASGTAFAQLDGVPSQNVVYNWAAGFQLTTSPYISCDSNLSYATITYTEDPA